jgi:hypothetical protein
MRRPSIGRVATALALATLIPGCRDASTAPANSGETVVISVAGLSADAAGIVLRLSGGVEQVEAARASLDVAWALEDATTATVAVLGPIAELNQILIVRRRARVPALTVQVIDVTDGDGILSPPAKARVVITGGT